MQQAARISDYTAFMMMGELIEVGKTKKIFTNPKEKLTEDITEELNCVNLQFFSIPDYNDKDRSIGIRGVPSPVSSHGGRQ